MSETAAPASPPTMVVTPPAPAPTQDAPPPTERLSVSEAARRLGQHRQERAREQAQAPSGEAPAPVAGDTFEAIARALGGPEGEAAAAAIPGFEVDGTRYTQDELRKQLSLASDYTKKTQALADAQRQLQQQQEALALVLPYLQPEFQALSQKLQGATRPDDALVDTNPQEYLRQMAAWQRAVDEQGRLAQLGSMQQQAQERAMMARVEAANRVLSEKYPFWRDTAQRGETQKELRTYAIDKVGFSPQEINTLADHRQVEVLMKAMMYDRLAAGARTSAPVETNGAAVRGRTPTPRPAEQVRAAEQRFAERPNWRNAADVLNARRAAER